MSRGAAAAGAVALLLAAVACDGSPEPEGLQRVNVREREPHEVPRSGATADVIEHLRAPEHPQRVVYDPPVDLRRPPGAAEWPPVAGNWPGAGEAEPAGAVRPDDPVGGAREPMGEPPDTAAAGEGGPGAAEAAPADTAPADTAPGDPAPTDPAPTDPGPTDPAAPAPTPGTGG